MYKINNKIIIEGVVSGMLAKMYKTRSSVSELEYHLVWCTKYRNKGFTTEMQKYLKSYILSILKDNNCIGKAIEVMPNHVHLLLQMPPSLSVTMIMKKIKGATARRMMQKYPELHQKFYGGHLWSPSYFAKSTGNCSDEIIQKYINTQWERPFK